jgi:hypothetical protein
MVKLTKVILYKHGVGHFERQGHVEGDATLSLTFKQAEVSDVLKSLTVLDLDGGHIAAVSYDSSRPPEQLLAEVDLHIPNADSLVGLLPQLMGARVAVEPPGAARLEGVLLGVDHVDRPTPSGVGKVVLVSLLTDGGDLRSFELQTLGRLEILDPALRRDLDFYLRTVLSTKKKDARTFTLFAEGQGSRSVRVSYTVEAPVWKATYRIILGEEGRLPTVQGWAVVDNTQDEDWEDVELVLVAGLPVSFRHNLYTPRFIKRPEVEVKETTGVLPPQVEEGMALAELGEEESSPRTMGGMAAAPAGAARAKMRKSVALSGGYGGGAPSQVSSMPAQVRERQVGDLFEYRIEHPVTIRRNQSALVPIVLRPFEGRTVLLYNKAARAENPLRCVEFKNTTGLTLEGGPVTVLEAGSYVGEAMLDTLKPGDERLVPYAVELSVRVLDNVDSHQQPVHRVVIRDQQLTEELLLVRRTTYHFNSKSDHEQIVYLDHLRDSDWSLTDTPAAHETTETWWRFRFALAPKQVTTFVVQQRQTLRRTHALTTELSASQVKLWVSQKYLDKAMEKALRAVLEAQEQAAEEERALAQLREERESIHAEQKRLRENLQALGDRSSEKELRERLVRTLNSQEDRLEKMEAEVKTHTTERDRFRAQVRRLLRGLEYEATLA